MSSGPSTLVFVKRLEQLMVTQFAAAASRRAGSAGAAVADRRTQKQSESLPNNSRSSNLSVVFDQLIQFFAVVLEVLPGNLWRNAVVAVRDVSALAE